MLDDKEVIVDGISIYVSDVQFVKALEPILVMLPQLTVVREDNP